ncbi:MAG: ABC transporter ATP-binding protein [Bacteroidota bacterium]
MKHIRKRYGDLEVFRDFSVSFPRGKISCLLGPSGCGKTTIMNLINGFDKPDSGTIDGIEHKKISNIFQEPRLLPWKKVKENIFLVLENIITRKEAEIIVERYLSMVELTAFQNFFPHQLSGGMKQRVAIARAFSWPSDIILMDEPFRGLDLKLKKAVMDAFLKTWESDRRTVVFVTHDVEEAVKLSHEIFVLTSLPATIKTKFSALESKEKLTEDLKENLG